MFDYKEGNLSQSEMDYLDSVIEQNPQHSADVEAWDNAYVTSKTTTYPGVNNLQKTSKAPAILGWSGSIASVFIIGLLSVLSFNNSNLYKVRNSSFSINEFENQNNDEKTNSLLNTLSVSNSFNNITQSFNNSLNESSALNQITDINPTTSNEFSNSVNNNNISANFEGAPSKNSNINKTLIESEINKIDEPSDKHIATYQNNPKFNNTEYDFSKSSKSNYGSIGYKLKKVFKKIEKMSGYPVGLINLHDPEINIPNSNILAINSSFAGGFGTPRFETKYRNQWLGQDNNIQSMNLSFDTYAKSLKGGIGVYFNREDINNGTLTNNNINLIYSPKFKLNSNLLFEPSVKFTMGLMQLNSSNLENNSTLEIENGRQITFNNIDEIGTANNFWYKDVSAGFILNHEKFYIGMNASNLGKHNQDIFGINEKSSIRFEAIAGADYQSRNKKMTLSPFVNYNYQNNIKNAWAGLNIKYNWLVVGGAYSIDNDFSLSLGAKFKTFRLLYQYDRTTSYLMNDKFSSHTIGLRINTKQKNRR
jgi:type IX secretion system PorP/SprF family membrane protein